MSEEHLHIIIMVVFVAGLIIGWVSCKITMEDDGNE
jgi:uncharacterized membrane protein YciS (DUF1049 family)